MAAPFRVVAFSGSARPGSFSKRALEIATAAAANAGASVELIDLAEWRLPLVDESATTGTLAPEIARLRATAEASDALLFATPVYHDSLSGLLKLALDLLPSELLVGRVAGLIAVGGGRHGHGLALEHLRTVLREMGVWTLPRQVIVPTAQELLDDQGRIQDPELLSRLTALGAELVLSTTELRASRLAPGEAGG